MNLRTGSGSKSSTALRLVSDKQLECVFETLLNMSSGPPWAVAYTKPDGTLVEVFCSTERGANDYKAWLVKVDPKTDAVVQKR